VADSSSAKVHVVLTLLDPEGKTTGSACGVVEDVVSVAEPTLAGRYASNLVLSAAIGVATCVWLAVFTEYLPVVATTLGLGGSLVWIAFVANLIPETRRKQLQEIVDREVLTSGITTCVLSIVGVLGFIYALNFGALLFISKDDVTARSVTAYTVDPSGKIEEPPVADDLLSGNTKLRMPLATFLCSRRYLIRVTGLPPIERAVSPFSLTVVRSPASFMRQPVLIVRAAPLWADVAAKAHNWTLTATVRREGAAPRTETLPDYDGSSVWIGCDATVPIPDGLKARWRDALKGELPAEWLQTRSVLGNVALRPDDVIDVVLRNAGNVPVAAHSTRVKRGGYDVEHIQEIYLEGH
jgi:hypothetical protein